MQSLDSSFHSISTMSSCSSEQIGLLLRLGIRNIGDLLAYEPFRCARFILAAHDQLLRKDEIVHYLDESVSGRDLGEILTSPPQALKDVGRESAAIFEQLGMTTIADVARFAPFTEAEQLVTRHLSDDSDPFAPAGVLPTSKKFTRNSKSFVSFFRQEEVRTLSMSFRDGIPVLSPIISELFRFNNEPKVIYLGYSVSYLQEWIFRGVHLGEPQGSINLFMGQDTQVSVLDWRRAMRALRIEDTRATERLASTLFHQRAVDEVARATAEEHQQGATSAFGANAATAGSFVAAGAVVGGVGGGISGAVAGLVLGNVANAAGGAPTIAGTAIGTAVGSLAGAAAGSLIYSGATTLGFVETDAEGDRAIVATSAQNIQQRTVQNSSSLRSFWSNIISQSVEEEQQQLRTNRVTNHNRIHALNALYFEVLNEYQVNMRAADFTAILFLPYKPIRFTEDILRHYWWLIRTFLNDPGLVLALDQHFQSFTSDASPGAALAELPAIDEIQSEKIVVKVNLDGSFLETLAKGASGIAQETYLARLREHVRVRLVTSTGTFGLVRDTSQKVDLNYVSVYATNRRIALDTIEAIEIHNDNPEFTIDTFDLTEVAFERISADVTIMGKNRFSAALPRLGALEGEKTVRATTLQVSSNQSKTVSWTIADRLRSQFAGINEARSELEAELDNTALTALKISNLLSFLNANKFGFTRLILQNTEAEQLISILEELQIGGVDLGSIAGTVPLGFCGNHIVLPLKKASISEARYDPLSINVAKLKIDLMQFDDVDVRQPEALRAYINNTRTRLTQFLQNVAGRSNSVRDQELVNRVELLKTQLNDLLTVTGGASGGKRKTAGAVPNTRTASLSRVKDTPSISTALSYIPAMVRPVQASIRSLLAFINTPIQTSDADMRRLRGFYSSIQQALKPRMGELLSTTEISLPSPAVFMEPILSNAKGAELYDMRRNSHYEILPAPGIGAVDPNVLRAREIALTPTIPPATLAIQNAPEYPLPTSLAAVLAEAGKLDLSTLMNTNAATLTSTLSNLSAMATELAKASAQLTGDAQRQALASATDIAKQIDDIMGKALPPQTQQEKAEVARAAKEIDEGSGTPKEKESRKKAIGAPTPPDEKRNYQFLLSFLDADGAPYIRGAFTFTLTLTLLEYGKVVNVDGGAPLELGPEGFLYPEPIPLTKGRSVKFDFVTDIGGVLIPGGDVIVLGDSPDILIKCTMKTETRDIQSTTVTKVLDTAVETSSFGAKLEVLLKRFLNAGGNFPFKIAKVIGGLSKVIPNLDIAYNTSTETTTGEPSETTEVTTYKVTIPLNGWDISVK